MSREFKCEICGQKIGATNRTLVTEFPMIYSGEITVCGDLCSGCRKEIDERFNIIIKDLKRRTV